MGFDIAEEVLQIGAKVWILEVGLETGRLGPHSDKGTAAAGEDRRPISLIHARGKRDVPRVAAVRLLLGSSGDARVPLAGAGKGHIYFFRSECTCSIHHG